MLQDLARWVSFALILHNNVDNLQSLTRVVQSLTQQIKTTSSFGIFKSTKKKILQKYKKWKHKTENLTEVFLRKMNLVGKSILNIVKQI